MSPTHTSLFSRLTLITLIICMVTSFNVQNLNPKYEPENSEDYIQYVKAIMSQATIDELEQNPKLAKIVEENRISIFNAIEDMVLVLVDEIADTENAQQKTEMIEQLAKVLEMDLGMDEFEVVSMVDMSADEIKNKIQEMQRNGVHVNVLEVDGGKQVLEDLMADHRNDARKLEEEVESSNEDDERVLTQSHKNAHEQAVHEEKEQAEETDDDEHEKQENTESHTHPHPHVIRKVAVGETSVSYILKFFFSLMFIIVSLGSLWAIANMENRKDTLLYAKFIADVGR